MPETRSQSAQKASSVAGGSDRRVTTSGTARSGANTTSSGTASNVTPEPVVVNLISSDEEDEIAPATGGNGRRKRSASQVESLSVPVFSKRARQDIEGKGKGKAKVAESGPASGSSNRLFVRTSFETPTWSEFLALSETLQKLKEKEGKMAAELAEVKEKMKGAGAEVKEKMKGAGAVAKKSIDLESLESHLSCDVCDELLWKPWNLTECGHTHCEKCLVAWFKEILEIFQRDVSQDYDPYADAPYISDAVIARLTEDIQDIFWSTDSPPHPIYTCPTCRKEVRNLPCETFKIKSMVQLYAEQSGEEDPEKGKKGKGKGVEPSAVWAQFFGLM